MPLSVVELRDQVIEEGIASIRSVGYPAHKESGAIAGMELCRSLLTLAEYRRVIAEREAWERQWRRTRGNIDEYWEHVFGTRQVVFVYEVMRVAWRDGTTFSGKAMRIYIKYMQPEDYAQVYGPQT